MADTRVKLKGLTEEQTEYEGCHFTAELLSDGRLVRVPLTTKQLLRLGEFQRAVYDRLGNEYPVQLPSAATSDWPAYVARILEYRQCR